jgi:hypothetical protein
MMFKSQTGDGGRCIDILDCTKADLDKWIYQGLELAFFAALRLCVHITCPRQHNSPEVNTMNILPVVHLLVRFL